MPHADFPDIEHLCGNCQEIVKICWCVIADIHLRHYQHAATILDGFVIVADAAEHFHSATLKVVEVICVVDPSLTVGFLVGHSKLKGVSQ